VKGNTQSPTCVSQLSDRDGLGDDDGLELWYVLSMHASKSFFQSQSASFLHSAFSLPLHRDRDDDDGVGLCDGLGICDGVGLGLKNTLSTQVPRLFFQSQNGCFLHSPLCIPIHPNGLGLWLGDRDEDGVRGLGDSDAEGLVKGEGLGDSDGEGLVEGEGLGDSDGEEPPTCRTTHLSAFGFQWQWGLLYRHSSLLSKSGHRTPSSAGGQGSMSKAGVSHSPRQVPHATGQASCAFVPSRSSLL